MLRELDFLGAFVPAIAVCFVLSLIVFIPLDAVMTRLGFYRLFWYEPLARFALLACLFCGTGLIASMQ
ncbi:MAG: DUF1656 domain-containing protein [Candidatus Eremiobacteraeota bacterium]|nr:DUF1656 domain-containing protein [Candidatus Eremiobacteraeota bacterium]